MLHRFAAASIVAALALSACSSPETEAVEPASKRDSAQLVEISPLTGQEFAAGAPDHPIMVVKIDNSPSANPQYGLDEADLVVEQLVEAGFTRLAAFFHTTIPEKVGPTRSARATDIGIASPVAGEIAASGGAKSTSKRLRDAGLTFHSEEEDAKGFSRNPAKSIPYNQLLNLQTLVDGREATEAANPYFKWANADESTESSAPKSTTATSASVRFSPRHTTTWALDGDTWSRTNGVSESEFRADAMVVLFADVGDAGYVDVVGNSVPETIFEGSGRAVIFRGDSAIDGTWSKDGLDSTIAMEDAAGTPVTLEPGKVWVELVPKGQTDVSFD